MIHIGDCRESMRGMTENSIDAIVTDPPYGLSKQPDMVEVLQHWLAGDDYKTTGGGFMGKSWDSFVPGPATWREAYRVLKPGGHALVFAGSRTQDLMGISLRLAGFEVRDCLMWIYGSGFPKSSNVSRAVDAAAGHGPSRQRALQFTDWMRSTGITAAQINEATGSCMGSHYLTDKEQPSVATLEMYVLMAHLLPPPPPEIMHLMEWRTVESENLKQRKVIGRVAGSRLAIAPGQGEDRSATDLSITAAHTPAAKQWEGWGTALKPAYEPILLVRKPPEGTIADNVLKHGVGGLNIDGCRVGVDKMLKTRSNTQKVSENRARGGCNYGRVADGYKDGRWPANVMHDGLDEPWARYFYCPKASKADRNEGCEYIDRTAAGDMTGGRAENSDGLNSPRAGAGRTSGARNHHPTVKPTALMQYLCRLVTPSGGTILDPFTGSGSTGKAATLEGFGFVGCELDETYARIAQARIDDALVHYYCGTD